MISFISFLLASGLGFGLSCWILGTLLEKSNSIGDSRGTKSDYNANAVFTIRKDRMSGNERNTFCDTYAVNLTDRTTEPKGSEQVRRLSSEELDKYSQDKPGTPAAHRAFFPDSTEEEFRIWESKQTSQDLTGIFKPLDEE